MKKPREQRIRMKLPVRVWGMDTAGKLFSIQARTFDITPVGACVEGVRCLLQRGTVIGIQCGRSQARFRVVWIGNPESRQAGQIGVRCMEPGKYIWGVPLERQMEDEALAAAKFRMAG